MKYANTIHRNDQTLWFRKDLVDWKVIGTPEFQRAQNRKKREKELREEAIERRSKTIINLKRFNKIEI